MGVAVGRVQAGTSVLQAPVAVVTSFSILADLVAQVGGPWVKVESLVGPDADAHAFEPTPRTVQILARAELVVVNGLHFEGWIERLVRVSGFRGVQLEASRGVTPRRLGREIDPHAWQDPAVVRRYVLNIREALQRLRPEAAADLQQRADAYLARLDALDRLTRNALAAVPAAERRIVTTHDAFGYFAQAYGVEFLSIQGWNRQGEASAADVARLIRLLRQQKVRVVFVENIADPRLIQQLAREAGAVVGGTLYSDALSRPGTSADTYLKLFEHNARTIAEALKSAQASAR